MCVKTIVCGAKLEMRPEKTFYLSELAELGGSNIGCSGCVCFFTDADIIHFEQIGTWHENFEEKKFWNKISDDEKPSTLTEMWLRRLHTGSLTLFLCSRDADERPTYGFSVVVCG